MHKKCTVFGTKKGPKTDTQLFSLTLWAWATTKLVVNSVFSLNVMDFSPICPMFRMQKSPKHCFWYQNLSNLLQVRITYNTRCLFEHENHNTSCKQLVPRNNLYGCKKFYSTVFGTKKDQNCYGAVFLSLYDLISKSPMQSCTDCKKSKAMNCTFGNSVRTIYLQSYLQVAKEFSVWKMTKVCKPSGPVTKVF